MIPIVVVSTLSGLVFHGEALVSARSQAGSQTRVVQSGGMEVGAWWCPDPPSSGCVEDFGGGCPFDSGHHEVLGFAAVGSVLRVQCEAALAWSAIDSGGGSRQGLWAGPADWNLDGRVDSPDLFDFLRAWFAGSDDADFDSDGALAAHDVIAFIDAFLPPA